jgi:hypothetical protein
MSENMLHHIKRVSLFHQFRTTGMAKLVNRLLTGSRALDDRRI